MAISNALQNSLIEIISPSLIKDYYLKDQQYEFPKVSKLMGLLKKFLGGGGILLDEGNEWHRRRQILNRVFTHNFVKSRTQKIK